MIDDTETPVLANLTEALAPVHEPAPAPAPSETTITLPSGEVLALSDVLDPRDAPPELDGDDDEPEFTDADVVFDFVDMLTHVHAEIGHLVALTEVLEHTLALHSKALNQILHGLTGPDMRVVRRKAKPKAKTKAKAKTKRTRR